MIICHEKKIIFVKSKKTGGTSFEIALSKFCGPSCVITPISQEDEEKRQLLKFRGAQNFIINENTFFYNHISAYDIKKIVNPAIWNSYKKITIIRNPFDVAISRYYWEGGEKMGLNFQDYLIKFPHHLTENSNIISLGANINLDLYLRYEDIYNEIKKAGIDFISDTFIGIRAKSDRRPKRGASVAELYKNFPAAIELVSKHCKLEIEKFKYRL